VTALACAAVLVLGGCTSAAGPAPSTDTVRGDLLMHDPALVAGSQSDISGAHAGEWFVYSTGSETADDGTLRIHSSTDGITWRDAGTVWDAQPDWLAASVPGVSNLWAPELYEHDGRWFLYFAASTFGSNTSVIALATNETLDPSSPDYAWVDRGPVLASARGDDFNAIDPAVVEDADGTPWLAFGSFWSGIRMVALAWPDGLRADDDTPLRLADRQVPPNAIEAATIVRHDGDYFLFFSRDSCCRGVASTYNMAVGRAQDVTGPYMDRDGHALLADGGTAVLGSAGDRIGPGGESASGGFLAYHYYSAALGGAAQLGLAELVWDDAGWPSISG